MSSVGVTTTPLPHYQRHRTTPLFARIRNSLLRHYRRFSRFLKSSPSIRELPRVVLASILVLSLFRALLHHFVSHEPFDDITDMALYNQKRTDALADWLNRSAEEVIHPSDPTRAFNMSQVLAARKQWDWIYRMITSREHPPVLTKYKKRILRELFLATRYVSTPKVSLGIHKSCNYLNTLPDDQGELTSFTCAPTSHKCPDEEYAKATGFTPMEGNGVSWDEVVLVLVVGAGRDDFLHAITETWLARLDPSATVVIARDMYEPRIPQALLDRPNVEVLNYAGPTGLGSLDTKAFTTWKQVHQLYEKSNKKYFLKVDDDSYLVAHNLLRFLIKLDRWFASKQEPIYFGHPFCGHGDLAALGYATWCYAGGGAYGLNLEALGMLVRQITGGCVYWYDYVGRARNFRPVDDAYGGRYEDVMVGRCLRQAKNRAQRNGTSLLACGSFFPYAPLHYYETFGRDLKAMTKKLGDSYITLHNLMPSAMRYLDEFLNEYPIGGIAPFSLENPRLENELLRICRLEGKKMQCNYESDRHQSDLLGIAT